MLAIELQKYSEFARIRVQNWFYHTNMYRIRLEGVIPSRISHKMAIKWITYSISQGQLSPWFCFNNIFSLLVRILLMINIKSEI